ncbi:MAG: valine--tRNA ligase [Candidatus Moranbacteria bacterium]|nr:valine--tRNA ligase [Candidatus Moranbacteria bacterium]
MKEKLPKNYVFQKTEDKIYQIWEGSGFFNPDQCVKKGITKNKVPHYSISMPPPNVTGKLHLGHAEVITLEDILIRYHRMKGDKTVWIPGTDHASIATQNKVEKLLKKEGLNRHKIGKKAFLKRVEKFALESHDNIVRQSKKMGASCDWSREAYTLDQIRHRVVNLVFKMMHADGLIYRGERLVNWCPRCASTLADDEVEYKEQKAKLYTFRYAKSFPFAIATTRPETKLGDTAVAVNPKDKRYQKYVGKTFKVNFLGTALNLKVVTDREVNPRFGTGALGVTPSHSHDDWKIAEANKLKIVKVIDEKGNIRTGFGKYSGLNAAKAREEVTKDLKATGLLEKEEILANSLSLCYRCNTPIEVLPSLQWFINVNKKIRRYGRSIKELSTEAVKVGVFGRKKIRIIPKRFEKEYFRWMENLRDWCISRQIWFGHRVPVWCKGKRIYCGVQAPKGTGWKQEEDTLDTWFSSGLWTFSSLVQKPKQIKIQKGRLVIDSQDFKDYHPTSVLETGYDLIFFWVARMILMTTYAVRDIPFWDVYLHGMVRDDKGQKMSKSLGNALDPLTMIEKYGTDAVRLSLVVGSAPGNDQNLSEEKIAGFRRFTNKLWNIARFVITSQKFGLGEDPALKNNLRVYRLRQALGGQASFSLSDLWILHKMKKLVGEITGDLEKYRFSQAGEKLREFTWNDFADWYLEISKIENNSAKIIILDQILRDLLKLWHPFTPFVTEKIWESFRQGKLLMVERWPTGDFYKKLTGASQTDLINFELIKNIIEAIRSVRADYKIEPRRKIRVIIDIKNRPDYAGTATYSLIESQSDLIKNLHTGVKSLAITESGQKIRKAICRATGGVMIQIPLGGLIDRKKEIARCRKEKTTLENQIKNLKKTLRNKNFLQKAPPTVIEKQKSVLIKAQAELKTITKQLTELY